MPSPQVRLALTLSTAVLLGASAVAQESRARPHVAPSGRVTTSVTFDGRVQRSGAWFPGTPSHSGPSRITIDYGQPHARGRTIFGDLVPYGEVWRVGANWATRLTLDLDVRIGDLDVPRGEYTLFLRPREDGADLIVSLETRQWGTDYDPSRDFGQASMERRALGAATQSMAITLQPNLGGENEDVPSGTLRVAWGTVEYFTNWQILWP